MIQALTLAGLTLSGAVEVWHVFVLASLQGIVNAFDIPARQSFVIEMVGRRDLMNAIALNSSMVNGTRIVGPTVAGVAVAAIGEGWCFLLNGVSYIAVISGLLRMTPTTARRERAARGPVADDIREGFLFVRGEPRVRALLVLLGVVSITAMPYTVLMPIVADQILHGGPQALGVLMGAVGVGALIGALSLAARTGVDGLDRWVAAAALGFGCALLLFSFSRAFWLSVALLVPAGAMMMVQMAASNTLIQSMVPDALRGRVMSIYSMMFMGMAPFGALAAGAIAARIGAPHTVALGGLACVTAAAIFSLRLPTLRGAAPRLVVAEES
jgi:MFS family permease